MENNKKTIVLGITGSIAAYKGADLCSKLVQAGYDVNVIMTSSAQELVRPRTFLTLSQNPVTVDLWDIPDWRPGHIELCERSDLFVVAPATANFIGKLANGIADDALSTFALSHQKEIVVAPAMNPKMWSNAIVQENVEKLKKHSVHFVGPGVGRVACGDDGAGRMEEVNLILKKVKSLLS